jgi:DNA-binding response OmpR family regulator
MKAPQVLVVEDDETIRRILVTTLTAEKYSVDDASTVAAGTLLALQRFYDLVILDLTLPDGNGLELIKKVRQGKTNQSDHRAFRLLRGAKQNRGARCGSR